MVIAWVRNAHVSSFDKTLDTSFLAVLEASLTLIRFQSPSVAKNPALEYEKHRPHMQGYNLVAKMSLEVKSGAVCEHANSGGLEKRVHVTLLESQCFLDAALLVVLSKMRGGKTAHQLAVQAPAQRRAGPRALPFTKGFAKSRQFLREMQKGASRLMNSYCMMGTIAPRLNAFLAPAAVMKYAGPIRNLVCPSSEV